MELLGERWTVLVVSRLIDGCRRFNEIHRGVPRMSATLLSRRLTQLEDAGLVVRKAQPGGRGYDYLLTEAGAELEPLIMDLAAWGQRWARDMENDDLDPAFLAWSMHTRLNTAVMPPGRTVIEFEFTGTPTEFRRFWLVHDAGRVDMCLKYPGYDSDVTVQADIRRFVEAWRGIRNLRDEIHAGKVVLTGAPALCRSFPDWLLLSALAPYPRCRTGREMRTLARTRPAIEGDGVRR